MLGRFNNLYTSELSVKYSKSNRNIIEQQVNKIGFFLIRKNSVDYVLKNIPAKFGDDQSLLKHKKLGKMEFGRQQKFGQLRKKSIKSVKTEKINFLKKRKQPLDYVKKNIPAKFGDDQSI